MLKDHNIRKAGLALCASSLVIAMNTAAHAQTQDELISITDGNAVDDGDDTEGEETIVVTGSRLRSGSASEPLTVITSEDIELRGIQSVDQLFRQFTNNSTAISNSNAGGLNSNGALPNVRGNFFDNLSGGTVADLRGLGAGSTLVLVNGRRVAGEGLGNGDFIDISGIPIESIDRVEIVTSGASAIYGADAVAGVINIILKKDFNGGNINVRYEDSDSGGDIFRISGTYGASWGTGNLTVTGSYRDVRAVRADQFGLTTRDFTALGGTDQRDFQSTLGVFQLAAGLDVEDLDPSDPFASSVFLLPPNSGVVDDFTDPATLTQVPRDSAELTERLPISFGPDRETYGFTARLTQEVDLGFINEVFVDSFYNRTTTTTEGGSSDGLPPGLEVSTFEIIDAGFGVPFFDDFSFSGLREDLDFVIDTAPFVAGGIIPQNSFDTTDDTFSINAGIRGEFAENWTFELTGGYVDNQDSQFETGLQAGNALFGVFDPDTFDEIIAPNSLVRNDFLTNPEAAAVLANTVETRVLSGDSELITAQFIGQGQFFSDRSTGALELAYGGEYRREEIASSIVITSLVPGVGELVTVPALDFERETYAGFLEAGFVVVNGLELTGALRYEDVQNGGDTVSQAASLNQFLLDGFDQDEPIDELSPISQSDSAFTWRGGIAWRPIDDLLLRGSFGRSFRAPNARDVGSPSITFAAFGDLVTDPVTGELIDSFAVGLVSGGNADLASEDADTFNLGFVYSPTFGNHRFNLDFDYFIIEYTDRIATTGNDLSEALFEGAELREEAIIRDDDGQLLAFFDGLVNLAEENVQGFDVRLTHQTDIGDLEVSSTFALSHQTVREERLTEDDPLVSTLGEFNPRTRFNFVNTLRYDDFTLTTFINHVGNYEVGANVVETVTTTDLTASYTFSESAGVLNDLRLTVGAQNVFNVNAPFINSGNGFAPAFFDIRRRVLFAELRKSF